MVRNRITPGLLTRRELLRRGLAAEGFLTAETGVRSQDFGVISPTGEPDEGNDRSKP